MNGDVSAYECMCSKSDLYALNLTSFAIDNVVVTFYIDNQTVVPQD